MNSHDADAHALAQHLGGDAQVEFLRNNNDYQWVEMDAVTDDIVAEAKPAFTTADGTTEAGTHFRNQALERFQFAEATDRTVYYRFAGAPDETATTYLQELSDTFDIPIQIEILDG